MFGLAPRIGKEDTGNQLPKGTPMALMIPRTAVGIDLIVFHGKMNTWAAEVIKSTAPLKVLTLYTQNRPLLHLHSVAPSAGGSCIS